VAKWAEEAGSLIDPETESDPPAPEEPPRTPPSSNFRSSPTPPDD
jgi:hypothetical protein